MGSKERNIELRFFIRFAWISCQWNAFGIPKSARCARFESVPITNSKRQHVGCSVCAFNFVYWHLIHLAFGTSRRQQTKKKHKKRNLKDNWVIKVRSSAARVAGIIIIDQERKVKQLKTVRWQLEQYCVQINQSINNSMTQFCEWSEWSTRCESREGLIESKKRSICVVSPQQKCTELKICLLCSSLHDNKNDNLVPVGFAVNWILMCYERRNEQNTKVARKPASKSSELRTNIAVSLKFYFVLTHAKIRRCTCGSRVLHLFRLIAIITLSHPSDSIANWNPVKYIFHPFSPHRQSYRYPTRHTGARSIVSISEMNSNWVVVWQQSKFISISALNTKWRRMVGHVSNIFMFNVSLLLAICVRCAMSSPSYRCCSRQQLCAVHSRAMWNFIFLVDFHFLLAANFKWQ